MSEPSTKIGVSPTETGDYLLADEHGAWIGTAIHWPGVTEPQFAEHYAYLWAASPLLRAALEAWAVWADLKADEFFDPALRERAIDAYTAFSALARAALTAATPPPTGSAPATPTEREDTWQ